MTKRKREDSKDPSNHNSLHEKNKKQKFAKLPLNNKKIFEALDGRSNSITQSLLIKLIKEGETDLNACDRDGCTAVIKAIQTNSFNALKILCDSGASLTQKNKNGESPLDIAINCYEHVDGRAKACARKIIFLIEHKIGFKKDSMPFYLKTIFDVLDQIGTKQTNCVKSKIQTIIKDTIEINGYVDLMFMNEKGDNVFDLAIKKNSDIIYQLLCDYHEKNMDALNDDDEQEEIINNDYSDQFSDRESTYEDKLYNELFRNDDEDSTDKNSKKEAKIEEQKQQINQSIVNDNILYFKESLTLNGEATSFSIDLDDM